MIILQKWKVLVFVGFILTIACQQDQSLTIKASPEKEIDKLRVKSESTSSLFKLGKWQELPRSNPTQDVRQIINNLSESLSKRALNHTDEYSQTLGLRQHFCHSDPDGTYLMSQGNYSPAFSWPSPPESTDHLLLFLFDLDSYFPHLEAESDTTEQRFPMILWANANLDRNLKALSEGFGSRLLKLKGKQRSSSYYGLSLSNDYTRIFTSEPLRGIYYDYDGPCISKLDIRRQHRILALLIASPLPSEILFTQKAQLTYLKSLSTLSQTKSNKVPAWQLLEAILNRSSVLGQPKNSLIYPSYFFSATLIPTLKVDAETSLYKMKR